MTTSVLSVVLPAEKKDIGTTNASPIGSALDKAQLRRAQVRKAQIQHRQRKANYVKQLEIDVAHIRDLIADAQRDAKALRKENNAMKAQLRRRPTVPVKAVKISVPESPVVEEMPVFAMDAIDSSYGLEDITMTLDFDEQMNAPSFRISSSPSSSHYESSNQSLYFSDATSPVMQDTNPDQTQEAINFILALEHICRDHFHPSPGKMPGHSLMASALALRTAPPEIFTAASRTSPLLRSPKPADVPRQGECSWQAAGLSLHSLYGLACSISDAELELTPVQAWFELAGRYPLDVLLRQDVLGALKRELAPVVKCPHFGAVMEREAYESVVGRVLGGVGIEDGAVTGGEIEGTG
ncbi:hypothetical protein B0T14DRAFT_559746 [Immersiella caudata]|uniref:Uncharacterized protein n=1 Tax=Immersiella caudata TaxID=314043 RepID=A0AA40CAW7_9PEZI|nr:hypothetical protein B0T14DRAFT_559746 [Immersiella caudata]